MRSPVLRLALLVAAIALEPAGSHAAPRGAPAAGPPAPDPAAAMTREATAWLATLTPSQRAKAHLRFDHRSRRRWQATPGRRAGLAWGSMDAAQRRAAEKLLRTGLSEDGLRRLRGIIQLEAILRAQEAARVRLHPAWRDPGLYWIAVYGTPAARGTWSWRIEGHHYSRHFTCVDGRISVTPAFHGANPARVARGSARGLRVLAAEEDVARKLLASLDAPRRKRALLPTPARDFVPRAPRDLGRLPRAGLRATSMTQAQRDLLHGLLLIWGSALHPDVRRRLFPVAQRGAVHFAWMGSTTAGQPHGYRVHGPTFLLEYWHGRNHIHTVWRGIGNEYGAADLARAAKARAAPKTR